MTHQSKDTDEHEQHEIGNEVVVATSHKKENPKVYKDRNC
jgi:hypothetical protein